jgi:hypothetical protein
MMRLFRWTVAALCIAVTSHAAAQVTRGVVTTSKISTASPARYYVYASPQVVASASTVIASTVYPFGGGAKLVDVIAYQLTAGTTGTSWTINVRNAAGTSLLTTNATIPLSAGASAGIDVKGEMTCSGCTRPVIKTDGTADVAKGGYVDIQLTESGSYGTHPSVRVVLVFEPKQ